jgi:hypothetical protein
MKIILNCVMICVVLLSTKLHAQSVPKGLEVMEIIKIGEAYRNASDLSFNINITYSDSATPTLITEQIAGTYKIHSGKYWGMMDSIEFIQGGQFNLAIYHSDSVIVITDRQEYTAVLQLPLMDSLFREANIEDMSVKDIDDSTRMLHILFNPQSPYHSYQLKYDIATNHIKQVKYYLTEMALETPGASGVACVAMNFSNYSENVISDSEFKESKYVYRFADEIKLQPAFEGFRLMMNTKKEGD